MDTSDPAGSDELPWKKIIKCAVHEIRSPLSSLRTSVEILKMNRLDDEQSQKVMTMMNRQIEAISDQLEALVARPRTFLDTPVSHE